MQGDYFVIDAVAHAFDMRPENFASERYAAPINALLQGLLATAPEGYALDPAATARDWSAEDAANILFRESNTDVAVMHTVPIYYYKDGLSGFEKSVDAVKKYPNRFIGAYVAADPTFGKSAIAQMEEQVAALGPDKTLGLKLYPISWDGEHVKTWRMDDATQVYPMYERAMELGIRTVAIHKSLPLGPSPAAEAFHPQDIERAADAFPELNFEIVHGGMAFTEETAWLVARYPNIWINLETTNIILPNKPHVFGNIIAGLMAAGGEGVLDRVVWASGAMNCHPRPSLEAFADYQIPDSVLEKHGLFLPVPQLTSDHKHKIFAENYARLHNLDLDAIKAGIENDEFAQAKAKDGVAAPYSTTPLKDSVLSSAPAEDAAQESTRETVSSGV